MTPEPEPQRSPGGRAALRQQVQDRYNLRLILSYPLLRSLGELRVLNRLHDPRRNLYAPVLRFFTGIRPLEYNNYTLKTRFCQSFFVNVAASCSP